TNEIVLAPRCKTGPFVDVFYCNIERKTIVRLQIQLQGREAFEKKYIYTFVEHVEDVKFLQVI
ncbi:hypothetical protein, partial [Mycobacterium tuberculosis]